MADQQNPNNDLNDLVFRTMPRSGSLPRLANISAPAPASPLPAPIPTAPLPILKKAAAEAAPLLVPGASALPGQMPGVPPLQPMAVPPSTLLSDVNLNKAGGQMKRLRLIIGGIGVLVVIGLGLGIYFALRAPAPASPPAPTASNAASAPAVALSQIPDEWRIKYFGSATCTNQDNCGDQADPDHDGLTNLEEYQANTDPNNADTDADGIADGDEVHIFDLNPLNNDTGGNPKFLDGIQPKTHWNAKAHRAYNDSELIIIAQNIAKYGLHTPSTSTLDKETIDFYTNYASASAAGSAANTLTPQTQPGAFDRDTQRSDAIKQIGFALLKYRQANPKYPDTKIFDDMITAIKPLLAGKALNTSDPTNSAPYLYSYASISAGADFQLSYFSETQNKAIVYKSADMQKLYNLDQANQRDNQRKNDLEQLSSALNIYSNDHISGTIPDEHIYPTSDLWKSALAPQYIAAIPVDPSSKKDYACSVSADHSSFALQVQMENPPTGKKGYLCDPNGCNYY